MSQMAAVQARKPVQSAPASTGGVLQRKCHTKKPHLQRSAAGPTAETVPPIVHEVLRSPGQPLDRETREFMEPRFGHDFSRIQTLANNKILPSDLRIGPANSSYERDAESMAISITRMSHPESLREGEPQVNYDFSKVRVHTGRKAAESARAVNALAYSVGHNIVLGEERYGKGTADWQRLMAHELAHVIQQVGEKNEERISQKHILCSSQPEISIQRAVTYEGAQIRMDIDPLDPRTAPSGDTTAIGHTTFAANGQDIKGVQREARLNLLFPLPSVAALAGTCFLTNRTINLSTLSRVRTLTPGPWNRTMPRSQSVNLFGWVSSRNRSCRNPGNVDVNFTGQPDDLALRAYSLESEMQHAMDDRCLVNRYLKSYEADVRAMPEQFPRGYLGLGSCESRLDDQLKRRERLQAFSQDYSRFAGIYDSGSHLVRGQFASNSDCSNITITILTRSLPAARRNCEGWSPPR